MLCLRHRFKLKLQRKCVCSGCRAVGRAVLAVLGQTKMAGSPRKSSSGASSIRGGKRDGGGPGGPALGLAISRRTSPPRARRTCDGERRVRRSERCARPRDQRPGEPDVDIGSCKTHRCSKTIVATKKLRFSGVSCKYLSLGLRPLPKLETGFGRASPRGRRCVLARTPLNGEES